MSQSLATNPPRAESPRISRHSASVGWPTWLLPAFALACWALLVRHLSTEWTLNEQYHFGWLVPLLAAYLMKVRFEQCPAPTDGPGRILLAAILAVLAGAAVLAMPVREANLDWRVLEWWLVALAIGSSFLCLWQAGGLSWVRHFTFPILFFLIAVPIPRRFEDPWMQWLMRHNAGIAVEILHWLGIEGEARGNLIQLPQCVLGVDEACSGIRSLQGTIMLALFLGEILAFKWPRRVILLIAGALLAMLTNIVRTVFLGLAAARDGHSALDAWHDTAGFTALVTTSLLVIAVAWLIHPRGADANPSQPDWPKLLRGIAPRLRSAATPAAIALALLIAGFVFTGYWFHRQSKALVAMAPWTFELPADQVAFRETEIPPRTRKTLNYDEGYSGQWQDQHGHKWQAYFFQWLAGRNAIQTQTGHDPRYCLGAIGLQEVAKLTPVKFARSDVRLSFDGYHFRDGAQNVFVFNCLAEDVRPRDGESQARKDPGLAQRFAAAFAGRRQAGQRRLEVAIWDAPDATTATTQFAALLNRQMRLDAPTPP